MGPVETRRGEGPLRLFSWYPPGVSPEAPSDTQVPRRSASAVRVLSSSSHERRLSLLRKSRGKRFFFFFFLSFYQCGVRAERKRSFLSAGILCGFYVRLLAVSRSQTVNHRRSRFRRGLVLWDVRERLANSVESRGKSCGDVRERSDIVIIERVFIIGGTLHARE